MFKSVLYKAPSICDFTLSGSFTCSLRHIFNDLTDFVIAGSNVKISTLLKTKSINAGYVWFILQLYGYQTYDFTAVRYYTQYTVYVTPFGQ